MKKIAIIVLVLISSVTIANAQAAKSVFFELGGPGLASFNFDTRFGPHEDGIGGRVGVGGFSIGGSGAVFVPIALNYLFGKDGKNYFELGGGVTPVFASSDIDDDDNEDLNFSSTYGHLNFGYRLQPAKGGFTFRAFISPIFGSWGFFPYWGGVSFGYKF
jgi:hypothetical protein